MEQAALLFTLARSTCPAKRHDESRCCASGTMSIVPLVIRPSTREESMIPPEEWNKDFEIASVSRQDLQILGVPDQQIDSLTDTDMQHIAQEMANLYVD